MDIAPNNPLAKAYIAMRMVNLELTSLWKARGHGFTARMVINSAWAAMAVWDLMDHETRIATRRYLRREYQIHWKPCDPLSDFQAGEETVQ